MTPTTLATVDLGSDVHVAWDADGQGFIWHHPACRAWARLRFGAEGTGHVLEGGGSGAPVEEFTVAGSLLCPMGCGTHGFIRAGRWVPA